MKKLYINGNIEFDDEAMAQLCYESVCAAFKEYGVSGAQIEIHLKGTKTFTAEGEDPIEKEVTVATAMSGYELASLPAPEDDYVA